MPRLVCRFLPVFLLVATCFYSGFSPSASASPEETAVYKKYLTIEAARLIPPVPAVNGFDAKTLSDLYERTIKNPTAALDEVDKYDPTGIIGFCFGRAMTAYLYARQMGLKETSIRKLFIVGDLRSGAGDKPEWRFHVTTLAKGKDKKWYAIDPIMYERGAYKPLTASEWVKAVRDGWDRWHPDHKPKAKLFLVSAKAVLPDIRVLPDPEDGSRLIHLNFDPQKNKIEISASLSRELGLKVKINPIYGVSLEKTYEFFITTDEGTNDRFDFLEISVNSEKISYLGYFSDLLSKTKWKEAPARRSSGPVASVPNNSVPVPTRAAPAVIRKRLPLGFNLDPKRKP